MPSAGLPCTSSAILCFFAGFSSSVASVLVGAGRCAVVKRPLLLCVAALWPRRFDAVKQRSQRLLRTSYIGG